jgi:hypothetical protein
MTQAEFDALIDDATKTIASDISWSDDEDHSPAVEFRVEVTSNAGYPIFVRGSYNGAISTLTYALIHRGSGRIYGLDLGKDHHNPDCNWVGEKHKHRWTDPVGDKQAYVPPDITAPTSQPVLVWQQFCYEAKIQHTGSMLPPPFRPGLIWI